MRLGRRWKSFAWVCVKLFWPMIYCANPRTESKSQSVSLSLRGLGRQYPWIICDYDLATPIVNQPSIQPRMCKMDSSIFTAIIWLKFASMTRAAFPSKPSPEWANGENVSVARRNYYRACLSFILPTDPGVVLLDPYCRFHNPSTQIWRQWWRQSEFTISPLWGRLL